MKKLRIAINGFGRLGRSIARVIAQREDMELVALNDVASWEVLSYLLEFDSTHGKFPKHVEFKDQKLFIDGLEISLSNERDPNCINFGEVDIVLESSGQYLRTDLVAHHLKKGAKKVILTAPASDLMPTFVLGVNHLQYRGENIISNASCTTNCLAPICKILDTHFEVLSGIITTIHSYTNDQNLLDNAHRSDKRRSRSAANNIIPTTTGAAKNLHRVLPQFKNKLHGHSVRVPVEDVSMLDLNVNLGKNPSRETLNQIFKEYAETEMKGILRVDDKFGVSRDFLGDSHSAIIAEDLSFNVSGLTKIMAWYDNEWGYSNRIVEMARYIIDTTEG